MSAFSKKVVNHGIRDEVSEFQKSVKQEIEHRVNTAIDNYKATVATNAFSDDPTEEINDESLDKD